MVRRCLWLQAIALLVALPGGALAQSLAPAEERRLIFSPWTKLCGDAAPGVRLCVTARDGRDHISPFRVSVVVIERDGDQRKRLRVTLPRGVTDQHEARLILDRGEPVSARIDCAPRPAPSGGCVANYEAAPDLIDRMKSGRLLTVQAVQADGRPISAQFDLSEFAQAFDGPPTGLREFEEAPNNKDIREINKQLRDPHNPWRSDSSAPDRQPWKDDRLQPRLAPGSR